MLTLTRVAILAVMTRFAFFDTGIFVNTGVALLNNARVIFNNAGVIFNVTSVVFYNTGVVLLNNARVIFDDTGIRNFNYICVIFRHARIGGNNPRINVCRDVIFF